MKIACALLGIILRWYPPRIVPDGRKGILVDSSSNGAGTSRVQSLITTCPTTGIDTAWQTEHVTDEASSEYCKYWEPETIHLG